MSEPELSQQTLSKLLESRAQFLGFLRKRIASPEVAEDLLQNAFVKSIEKSGELRSTQLRDRPLSA
jgi:RNA polymerase sigma-70 factor (ECF subfamily)